MEQDEQGSGWTGPRGDHVGLPMRMQAHVTHAPAGDRDEPDEPVVPPGMIRMPVCLTLVLPGDTLPPDRADDRDVPDRPEDPDAQGPDRRGRVTTAAGRRWIAGGAARLAGDPVDRQAISTGNPALDAVLGQSSRMPRIRL